LSHHYTLTNHCFAAQHLDSILETFPIYSKNASKRYQNHLWPELPHQVAICWLEKELSWPIGLENIVKIAPRRFQHQFNERFCETSKNFSSFRQPVEKKIVA
jgi:hypothetical protein